MEENFTIYFSEGERGHKTLTKKVIPLKLKEKFYSELGKKYKNLALTSYDVDQFLGMNVKKSIMRKFKEAQFKNPFMQLLQLIVFTTVYKVILFSVLLLVGFGGEALLNKFYLNSFAQEVFFYMGVTGAIGMGIITVTFMIAAFYNQFKEWFGK